MSLSPLKLPKDYTPDNRPQPIWSAYHLARVLDRHSLGMLTKKQKEIEEIKKQAPKKREHGKYKGARFTGYASMWHSRFSRCPAEVLYLAHIAKSRDTTLNEELDNVKEEFARMHKIVQVRLEAIQRYFNVPLKQIARTLNEPYQNIWVWTQRNKMSYQWGLYVKMKKAVWKLDPYRWGRKNHKLVEEYKICSRSRIKEKI